MTITVKRLIEELQKIENKYLEVECHVGKSLYGYYPIVIVRKMSKKVILYTGGVDERD